MKEGARLKLNFKDMAIRIQGQEHPIWRGSPSSCSEAGRRPATTTASFIGELGHRVDVVDGLGVAGRPLLVDLLELALSLPDVVPEHLALQLVLDDLPLLGGEHGGVEGRSFVLGDL